MAFPSFGGLVGGGGGVASNLISSLAPATQMSALADTFNAIKETSKDKKGLSGVKDIFSGIKDVAMMPFTIMSGIMDFMKALGIVEPILNLITMLIEILGASIMKKMMPAFMRLFNALMESGIIDLIIIIGELIGGVLSVVFDALAIALKAMNPLFEVLSDILGSDGMQQIIMVLGKILGTLIIVGFIPLILVIYAFGTAIAFLMDLFTLFTQDFSGQWQEGLGGTLLETVGSLTAGIGELWAMDKKEEDDYVESSRGREEPIIINIDGADMDPNELATEIEYRRSLGR